MSLLSSAPQKELLPCTLGPESFEKTTPRKIDLVVPSSLQGSEISMAVRTG